MFIRLQTSHTLMALFTLAAALRLVTPAWSAPTGLVVIPTADVLDRGSVCLDYSTQGRDVVWGDDCDRFLGVQAGLAPGLEAGVDECTNSSDGPWLNLKWQVVPESEKGPAIALGLQAIGEDTTAEPYLVLSRDFSLGRLHLGALRAGHAGRLLVGGELPVERGLTAVGDFVSGPAGTASLGLTWQITSRFSLMAGRIWNRGAGDEDQWYVDLGYAVK